jgi:hypothetical protein
MDLVLVANNVGVLCCLYCFSCESGVLQLRVAAEPRPADCDRASGPEACSPKQGRAPPYCLPAASVRTAPPDCDPES